ncbi:MAG: saccharopine dehydrogenase C-terminal domain-containing protein [Planctomycetota bacterium]|mgnify:CR=1 FL=1|nr:saccharopine dehydrogenase C-terminal domain-containing protein [Planctomycetota bacterium]
MSGFRYIVFGAGRQGLAALHDLVVFCQAERVIAVEPDEQRSKAARERLSKLLGRQAAKVEFKSGVSDAELSRADVALSCAPYSANLALTSRAVNAGVAFCDLGGNPEVVSAQEKLALKSKVPVVPDCGVSPGLSNILAVHCAREHGCDEVHVRCGGLPLVRPDAATNPLLYKLVFSPWGLISEYSGDVPVIRAKKLAHVEALSVVERFEEGLEASPTSNNSPQVVEYMRSIGVHEYDYMTLRYDGHWGQVRGWKSLGYLVGDPARDRELADRLELDPVLRYDSKKDRDRLILSVRGTRNDAAFARGFSYRLDVAADTKTRFAAMELTTCWGITIVAHHMASGRGKPRGFATPERFVDTTWVISEIERRLATLR